MDAWEAVVQAPFRALAIWLNVPAFEQLGELRAKMIAKPSYPIYVHYITKWITANPEDQLFIAEMMTAAAVSTVLQEAWLIWRAERLRRKVGIASPVQVVSDASQPFISVDSKPGAAERPNSPTMV